MLIRQASINMVTSIASALLGLASVVVLTRLFSPRDYGVYLLGFGFASVLSVFLVGWFRNLILSRHARADGGDVRGTVAGGFLLLCLTTPLSYGIALLLELDRGAALAAIALAMVIGLFELTQDLLRARLAATDVMKSALVRAAGFLILGAVAALVLPAGWLLLLASLAAYAVAIMVRFARAWRGTVIRPDAAELMKVARHGLPLTLSLTLLAIASVTDRFVIAALVDTADAARYVAGLDLVRQALMMPALSAAAAFHPMAIQIKASRGDAAVRDHLSNCVELLLAMIVPVALGLAVISPHLANIVLGQDFRALAIHTMPIVAVAVVFQILTQQYLHLSFLLSGRNGFYLINACAVIVANLVLSGVLITSFGAEGAAWARLGADAIGFGCALVLTRFAFPVPFPLGRLGLPLIAGLAMAMAVVLLDRALPVPDLLACFILAGFGAAICFAIYWLLDVAMMRQRLKRGLALLRPRPADLNLG